MGIFVYMLRCSDGSYYVGSATGDDLGPRIDQHNAGAHRATLTHDDQSCLSGLSTSIGERTELPSNGNSRAGAARRRKR